MGAVYDVSHYQSNATVAHALATGAEAIFVKATEGTGYVDPAHDADVRLIRGAKRRVGHYHFANHVGSAVAEAAFFLANAHVLPGDLVALDLEAMDGTWAQRVAYALAWIAYVELRLRCRVLWYCNTSWRSGLLGAATPAQKAALMAHPLWIATGGVPMGQPLGPGVGGWALHQYSTAGGIDHDFIAPSVSLANYAVPAPVVPAPPNVPKPNPVPVPVTWGKYYDPTPSTPPPVDVAAAAFAIRRWSGHVWRKWWAVGTRTTAPWPVDIPPRADTIRQWDGRTWTYRKAA